MRSGRNFLWQDVQVVLDDKSSDANAFEWRTPPEAYLRTNGARAARFSFELTCVPLGTVASYAVVEFETADTPEPFNIVGPTSTDRGPWKAMTSTGGLASFTGARGKESFHGTFNGLVAETEAVAGLHEFVRVRLHNPDTTAGAKQWVHLRVWATLVDC